MAETPAALGLDPDWGDDAVAEALGTAFDIEIGPGDFQGVGTAGELYDRLQGRVRRQGGGCATAMAFWRLRRALQPAGEPKLAPDATMKPLLAGMTARAFHRRLGEATGLEIPTMAATVIGLFGYGLFLGGVSAGAVALLKLNLATGLFAVAAVGLSLLLMRLDPQRLPADFETVGQLARHVAAANFQKLAVGGAAITDDSIWQTMRIVLADQGTIPVAEITRETPLHG